MRKKSILTTPSEQVRSLLQARRCGAASEPRSRGCAAHRQSQGPLSRGLTMEARGRPPPQYSKIAQKCLNHKLS